MKIEFLGTDEMVADYFTKPLQGTKFVNFRKQILNLDANDDEDIDDDNDAIDDVETIDRK